MTVVAPPNQTLRLTGAAILVSRGITAVGFVPGWTSATATQSSTGWEDVRDRGGRECPDLCAPAGSAEHVTAIAWLTRLAEDPLLWGLPVFCLDEFVRVVTHPRIFDPPTRLESALEALFGLLASPSLRALNPGYPELFS